MERSPSLRGDVALSGQRGTGLVDVLDRVLDKGLVIAGDIKVSLAEVELLTIRIRLIICSIDKAQEIGMDWWKHDRNLAPGRNQAPEEPRPDAGKARLAQRLARRRLAPPAGKGAPAGGTPARARRIR